VERRGPDHAREVAAQLAQRRRRNRYVAVDRDRYWHFPPVQVVPVGHTSTAFAPPANSDDVHAVPAATVPRTLSLNAPLLVENPSTVIA
jgi:hypothetical protein